MITATAMIGAGGCASNPQPQPIAPEPQAHVDLPTPPPPAPRSEAAARLQTALAELEGSNFDAAHGELLEVIDLCGSEPLGQQALLLIAAAELDPRNPNPGRSLAAESTALLLDEPGIAPWLRTVTESLYLIALRLGASVPGTSDPEAADLASRFRKTGVMAVADENPAEWQQIEAMADGRYDEAPAGMRRADETVTADLLIEDRGGHCEAAWPASPRPVPMAGLPTFRGASYPAQIADLRKQVQALEEEVERLRRIVTRQ
ncbi:MAG: hypothetical protein JSV95_01645 [Gemmatimonadota bacterium]|jgi:hypothetical protein|nr:MAG: hypothetical protein JSV95_01645 [Gemmatimonadota bacterium]